MHLEHRIGLIFGQSIMLNSQRLNSFTLREPGSKMKNNLKSYLNILNSLSACSKLKLIYFEISFKALESPFLLPKSFYNFVSHYYFLTEICFSGFGFDSNMDYQSFQSLISLQILKIATCILDLNSFESFFSNNFPKLNHFSFWSNILVNSDDNSNLNQMNSILKKRNKFPPIVEIGLPFGYCSDYIEYFMFQALINCKTLTMKYLKVTFGENCNSEIPKFHNFLKNSKI